jgi:hypothetical protein
VIAGYRQRLEHQQQIAAWHVCYILNCWRPKNKAPLRPNQLLGKGRTIRAEDYETIDEFAAAVAEAKQEAARG